MQVVPEHLRSTVYSIYRLPLYVFLVGELISPIRTGTIFKLNVILMLVVLVILVSLHALLFGQDARPDLEMPNA